MRKRRESLWSWLGGWAKPLAALLLVSAAASFLYHHPPASPIGRRPKLTQYTIRFLPAGRDSHLEVPMRIRGMMNEITGYQDLDLKIPKPLKFRDYPPLCKAVCDPPNSASDNGRGRIDRRPNRCFDTSPWIQIVDNPAAIRGGEEYAEDTLPCFLKLRNSSIQGAGQGIFTETKLFPGLLFGPYSGRIIRSEDFKYDKDDSTQENMAYVWSVDSNNNDTADQKNIDGQDRRISNWLRYVNTARFGEEQNMIAMIYDLRVYYLLFKEVEAGGELFVYYGHSYLSWLGFSMPDGRWENGVAPPKANVSCALCAPWDGQNPHDEPVEYEYEEYHGSHDGPPDIRPDPKHPGKKIIFMRAPMGPRRMEHTVAWHPELR